MLRVETHHKSEPYLDRRFLGTQVSPETPQEETKVKHRVGPPQGWTLLPRQKFQHHLTRTYVGEVVQRLDSEVHVGRTVRTGLVLETDFKQGTGMEILQRRIEETVTPELKVDWVVKKQRLLFHQNGKFEDYSYFIQLVTPQGRPTDSGRDFRVVFS